jgi:cytochrome c oxidase subunit II
VRRGAIVTLVLIGAVVGALTTGVALFVDWLPEQASEQREGIDFVFWLTTWICVSIFAVVAAVTIYSVWKFRAPPDDDSDGPPIHGHTGIEIVWTAIPTLLVVIIAVASAIVLARNDRVADDSLRVKVTAQQFAWRFEYPGGIQSETLHLPVDEDVVLELQAIDVLHSFWVPEFGQKQDAVPGEVTQLAITPTKVGEYPIICTELCGLGHSLMRSQALVMQPAAFQRWLNQGEQAQNGSPERLGATVFQEQGCGACHTFKPANATGKVGPDLDKIPKDPDFVRQSIVDPNAKITQGYSPNVMPQTFGDLPPDQLDALVQYLVGGAK